MSSPGSGTPGSSTPGAVGGQSSATPEEKPTTPPVTRDAYGNPVQPGQRYVVSIQRVQGPKGNGATEYLTYSTGETKSGGSSGSITSDQAKAEAEQQNIKELGFTPGAQFPSQSEINQKVANLGIKYESQTPNLVNGVLTSGQPSPRDLYVSSLLAEVATGYKGQGFKTEEDYLSNRLEQVGLSYNPQTKTITDPLEKGIIEQQLENQSKGGYAGISLGGGPVDIGGLTIGGSSKAPIGDITKPYGGLQEFLPNLKQQEAISKSGNNQSFAQSLENQNALSIPNNISDTIGIGGPATSLSEKLGSSFGQKGLGYVPAISPEGYLNYGPAQIASLISSVKNNPEYGGNQNFLVGNIGTENSTGSLAALNLNQSHNTDIPNSVANKNKSISLSETLGISEGIAGGSNLEKQGSNALGIGLNSLSRQQIAEHNLGVALSQVSNQQIEQRNLSIEEANQVITQLNNNAKVNFAVDYLLPNKPQSRYTGLAAILPPAGTDIVRAGLDFLKNTGLNIEATGFSIAERIAKANIFSSNPLGLTPFTILTPKNQEILNKYSAPNINEVKGVEGLVTGQGMTGFESGQGQVYDITQGVLTVGSLLIGSGITKAPSLVATLIAKSAVGKAIGSEAKSAAIIYSGKGSGVFDVKGTAQAELETTLSKNVGTYKNLNMMRTSLPKDIFESDTALGARPIGSASVTVPLNKTLENTASQIEKLRQTTNDLLKPSSIEPLSNKPVQEDVLFINKVPFKSLGSNNGVGTQIKKVDANAVLGTGTIPPEDLTGSTAPIKKTLPSTAQISTSSSSGLVPGSGVPGSVGIAGAVGGQSSAGVPDIFQPSLASRVDFERRTSERANPDLFESGFVPYSNEIISPSLRSTEIGQRLEALDLFKKGIAAKKNASYYTREGVPKELMGKFSKLISNQTVGSRPEIFGTKPVKLKLEDIEYNPAENFQPMPRTGKSPFDIQFGDIALFSKQEFTSNLLSPEEQALAERYPLMKNTLPNNLNPFNEPRTTPRTGTAPIQKDTFNISETVKGREEAKFFGTFELKTGFEEIGYMPRNENPVFVKTIPSGQRIESLDLFKTGIKAKLNPDYYQRIGIPKELMGKFSKEIGQQTTGNKLPEIFGEKAEHIIKESNLDAFYSPQENIRQFFERLESNKPNVHNNSNLKGYGIERLELNITKNKTKINTDKLLGIDNEEPAIGESKERLDFIEQGAIKRTQRESKLIKMPQKSEEIVFENARSFFEKEKQMFSENRISLGVGEGRLIPRGGGLSSILKNFGKPSNPPPKPEEPKGKETRSGPGLIQILKEQTKQENPFKEYPIQLGEGLITIPKKAKKITANLTGLESVTAQTLIQILKEQTPDQAQLFKQLQGQQPLLKQPELLKQIEENPFPNIPPEKQLQLLENIPQIPQTPHQKNPNPPVGDLFEEHKKYPKKKKEKGKLFNYIGNVPEFDIVGVFKRNETIYGNATIARLTAQDTANINKKYSEKYQTGKEKTLFTSKGNKIKVKGSTAKPKSLQDKFKKKIKI